MKKAAARILVSIGLLFLLVTLLPVTDWWARALAGSWDEPRGDILIVLGGDVLEDGTIGLHSYWRTVYAARAWRSGGFREIVISGASAAPEMKKLLVVQGVPETAIRLEERSTSTHENAQFTRAMLADTPGQRVLLTSEFHMFRARRAFRGAGVPVRGIPVPDVLKQSARWRGRWPAFFELCEETAKIAYYWARGWL
jgi:uncharacterized SAM-binding protein YcdF (DUF218 family)